MDPGGPDTRSDAIYGGQFAGTCDLPAVVQLANMFDACSGTLVHPRLVVYAAHCGTNRPSATFGESANPTVSRATAHCAVHPEFTGFGQGRDVAYCVLAEEAVGVPFVPVLVGCERAVLVAGAPITLAGFGDNDQGGHGYKKFVASRIRQVSGNELQIEGGQGDTCEGDSGGPGLVQVGTGAAVPGTGDNGWRTATVTSYGTGACGAGGFVDILAASVPWIEADSGIDITPCTDAAGTWAPTAACAGFPTRLTNPGGLAWPAGCGPAAATGLVATCGPAYAPPAPEPDPVPLPSPPVSAPEGEDGDDAVAQVRATARGCAAGPDGTLAAAAVSLLARAGRRRRMTSETTGMFGISIARDTKERN